MINEYLSTVQHKKLNVEFLLKMDAATFKRRKDDEAIECFENGKGRKFIKSYLTLMGDEEPIQPVKTKGRKKKSIK